VGHEGFLEWPHRDDFCVHSHVRSLAQRQPSRARGLWFNRRCSQG
jgi:hypothetical protein